MGLCLYINILAEDQNFLMRHILNSTTRPSACCIVKLKVCFCSAGSFTIPSGFTNFTYMWEAQKARDSSFVACPTGLWTVATIDLVPQQQFKYCDLFQNQYQDCRWSTFLSTGEMKVKMIYIVLADFLLQKQMLEFYWLK